MMVSSLLAFNACTKDGAQGPAGPAGPTGTAGAAGAVGPAGAKGADGTTILSGTAAPAASAGKDGDYFFDKTAKVLYGPKAAGAWPAEGVTLTGAAGKAGSNFLAGTAAPTDATGAVGDFYFSTDKSTFYGPKAADGTWTAVNQLPLGGAGAKVYYYNVGFSDVKEVADSKVFGQDIVATYPDFRIFSTYKVTAEDMIRVAQYPGWGDNREMAFETAPGNGVFTNIPADGAALQAIDLGTRFIFTHDTNKSPAIFNLSAADKVQFGTSDPNAFDYLINAKADPATIALGATLNFANVKNIGLVTSTTKYTVNYTAKVAFDLDKIIPNLEKNIQDGGLVILRSKNYNLTTGALDATWDGTPGAPGALAGFRGTYTIGGVEYGPGLKTTAVAAATNVNILGLGASLGQIGDVAKVGTQVATWTKTTSKQGDFSYEYSIVSGDAGTGSINTNFKADGVTPIGTSYYSVTGGHLTSTPTTILNSTTGVLTLKTSDKGQAPSFFTGQKLRLISATVLDATTVAAAKKAGINLEDANALEQFASKR